MKASARRAPARRKTEEPELKEQERKKRWAATWLDEAVAVACFALALFLFVSFLSHVMGRAFAGSALLTPAEAAQRNLVGPVGHVVGTILAGTLGWCALVPVLVLIWFSVFLWRYDSSSGSSRVWFSFTLPLGLSAVTVVSCLLAAVFAGRWGGGAIGNWLAVPLVRFLDTAGAVLVGAALLLLALALTTRLSVVEIVAHGIRGAGVLLLALVNIPIVVLNILIGAWSLGRSCMTLVSNWLGIGGRPAEPSDTGPRPKVRRNALQEDGEVQADAGAPLQLSPPASLVDEPTHVVVRRRLPERHKRRLADKIEKQRERDRSVEVSRAEDAFAKYRAPAFDLLTAGEVAPGAEDDNELLEKSRLIEAKLRDFGVLGKVTQVHPGPVITLYEFEPAAGVKVGRVAALADDLAMGLRASSIRIIAPIPKRGTVGIEIPNRNRDLVRLRDVLESEAFANADSVLSVCVGKDTYGDPVVVDIATMPHLLMAGATGTGKSVCINSILLSILYRASPAEVGFILIDPKILELSVYEGIPHLKVPVVTHPRQAKAVLQWAVDEMHRRYKLIQRFGVRNIDGYNRIVRGEMEPEAALRPEGQTDVVPLTDEQVVEEGIVDKQEEGGERPLIAEKLQPLPKILIVVDEVADLMLSVGRDIEELITRLAQKSRAAGIHLLIATQRPSVDVVTGLIKANFPSRISFRVATRIDSRTILDSMGAEKLLGRGDMLFMQPGAEALKRAHGAFVSDSEVQRVIAAVKAQCAPCYDDRIMRICEKALEEDEAERAQTALGGDLGADEYDPVYDKAVELVLEKGQASTSMIQRVFRIGYNRAARIIEVMEKEGIVGPMDGAKPREVLVPRADSSEV